MACHWRVNVLRISQFGFVGFASFCAHFFYYDYGFFGGTLRIGFTPFGRSFACRVMFPLIIFSIIISGLAFYFSNNLLRLTNLKMGTLLYDIRHKKPTMDLRPGVFYKGIDNYAIRVGSKGEDDVSLYDVLIYDHTENKGNNKIIVADSGRMEFEGDRYLMLTLYNGNSYEQKDNRSRDERTYPHMRNEFQRQIIRFDMAEFNMRRSSEEIFKDNYKMQSFGQLIENIDTLDQKSDGKKIEFLR
jgi:lipopolysaccharide export system permease protein